MSEVYLKVRCSFCVFVHSSISKLLFIFMYYVLIVSFVIFVYALFYIQVCVLSQVQTLATGRHGALAHFFFEIF